jgi:AraC-like DNA-binding protein
MDASHPHFIESALLECGPAIHADRRAVSLAERLPFSRYMLWRKLTRAMVAIGSEETIAAAAHAADFADAAHLTRTFYQMVGMAPSALMRGDFVEIASPFSPVPLDSGGPPAPRPAE